MTRLLNGCRVYCRFAIEHPGSYRVIFETKRLSWLDQPRAERPGMPAFRLLVDSVAACIAAGEAPPGDPFQIAANIWAALHGMVTLRQRLPGFPWPEPGAQLASMVCALTGTDAFRAEPWGGSLT